ncbi:MAG: FeoB small GTPase domain-containing protein [Vicinamibacterales bacterium]
MRDLSEIRRNEPPGEAVGGFDRVVALASNPSTGKSTLFNALTGLRQHTGNWPGKTVTRAEGGFQYAGLRYKLVDLPGTYSLLSASQDEEVARNFLLFPAGPTAPWSWWMRAHSGATSTWCCRSSDHGPRGRGREPDGRGPAARHRGRCPQSGPRPQRAVVPIVARTSENVMALLTEVAGVASGETVTVPLQSKGTAEFERAVSQLVPLIESAAPGVPNARWIAIRLLDGDAAVEEALTTGQLADLVAAAAGADMRFSRKIALQGAQ